MFGELLQMAKLPSHDIASTYNPADNSLVHNEVQARLRLAYQQLLAFNAEVDEGVDLMSIFGSD